MSPASACPPETAMCVAGRSSSGQHWHHSRQPEGLRHEQNPHTAHTKTPRIRKMCLTAVHRRWHRRNARRKSVRPWAPTKSLLVSIHMA
eukprot:2776837-Prymnesium_polylepis.2